MVDGPRIALVSEAPELERAQDLARRIAVLGGSAPALVVRESYPVADAMVRFLAGLEARYDRALRMIDEYLALWPETPHMHYNRACAFAPIGRLLPA